MNRSQVYRLIGVHLLLLLIFWTGVSPVAIATALILFTWRGIFLTISYHRYFSHRSFKTSRAFQFFLAMAGSVCMQRGALWWAANHRKHHQYSDTHDDPHSPVAHGFLYAHFGWAMKKESFITDYSRVQDFKAYPELRWLNEHSDAIHGLLALVLLGIGELLRFTRPELGTSGPQLLLWGYLVSGLAHLHTIFLVNSWGHLHGSRPYLFPAREGRDNSHNNWWLALLTFGEGWHYNHHCFPASAKVGLFPWQLDMGWITLKAFEALGLVWDLKLPSQKTLKDLEPAHSAGALATNSSPTM